MLPAPTGRTVHRLTRDGLVRDWLAGPVWSSPIDDLADFLDADGSPWGREGRWVLTNGPDVGPLKERLAAAHPLPETPPAAPSEGGSFAWAGHEGTWRRVHTGEDGFADWSAFCFTPEYRRALAATVLEVDQAEWRTLEFASTGPFVAWLDGEVVARSGEVSYMEPVTRRVRVRLRSGASTVHVATWQAAFRECRHILRLRVEGLPVRVVVPSPGADEWTAARMEPLLDAVGTPSWALAAHPGAAVPLVGPAGMALRVAVTAGAEEGRWQQLRLDDAGRGRAELPRPADGAEADTAAAVLDAAALTIRVRVDDDAVPLERVLSAAVLPADSRTAPVGDAALWRREVLEYAATGPRQTARAIARLGLDPTAAPEAGELETGLRRIETRGDCADFEVLALLHLLHRVPADAWDAALAARARAALTGLRYWIEQPGLDAMCFFTENHQFVWHVAERLSGALAPEATFADGRTGAAHAAEGAERAAAWMRRKLDGGFSEFDSNAYLAINALSLLTLIEYDDDPGLVGTAEALLDTMLLGLCANSWHGIHGSAHGRSYVHTLRSARFEETSPLLRVIAGVGSLHPAVLPAVALATATRYRIPAVLAELAQAEPQEWWATQSFRGEYALDRDLLERPYGSDLAVWRTPHGMLSCAQDYRPGLPGLQEHIGGAVLGREVQVFVTNPANADTSGSARPNAWSGHRVLPRMRQHRGAQLGLFPVSADGPAAGTHLWLPLAEVDEWRRTGSWLAARVGDGFVAVAAEGGLVTVASGAAAGQEHRPAAPRDGLHRWVTLLGDGDDFAAWCRSLNEPRWDDGITVVTPEGATLSLAWDGPFLVDGRSPDLNADGRPARTPRLDNPAVHLGWGDDVLDARWGGRRLTVDLAAGRRVGADLSPGASLSADRTPTLTERIAQ